MGCNDPVASGICVNREVSVDITVTLFLFAAIFKPLEMGINKDNLQILRLQFHFLMLLHSVMHVYENFFYLLKDNDSIVV